jgi:hypothetical protein
MSYVSQQFLLADNSSTANFKNWAQAISTAFTTAGWLNTSDTGQVNWSTVTVPGAGSFVYEIFKPNDALQTGSTQFFVKVKYGTSSSSGPRLQIQIGTGTDGSGNLTGFTTVNMDSASSFTGQGGVQTFECDFSGDTDRIGFVMWRNLVTGSAPLLVAIERTKDTAGVNNSDGVTLIMASPANLGSSGGQETIVFGIGSSTMLTQVGSGQCYMSFRNPHTNDNFNNNEPVYPVFPVYGKVGNPMTEICFVNSNDVAAGAIFSTTLYGSTRTYVANVTNLVNNYPGGSTRMCLRYD